MGRGRAQCRFRGQNGRPLHQCGRSCWSRDRGRRGTLLPRITPVCRASTLSDSRSRKACPHRPQHVVEKKNGKTDGRGPLRACDGRRGGRPGPALFQEPVLGATDGEYRCRPGLWGVLSEVRQTSMRRYSLSPCSRGYSCDERKTGWVRAVHGFFARWMRRGASPSNARPRARRVGRQSVRSGVQWRLEANGSLRTTTLGRACAWTE